MFTKRIVFIWIFQKNFFYPTPFCLENVLNNRGTYSAGHALRVWLAAQEPAPQLKNCHNCYAPRCSLTIEYTLLQVLHSVFRATDGAAR